MTEDNNTIYKFCCSYFFVKKDYIDINNFNKTIEDRFDKIVKEFKNFINDQDSLLFYQFNLLNNRYDSNWLGVCNIYGEDVELPEGITFSENTDCEYCLLKEIVKEEFKNDTDFIIVNIL